MSQSSQPRSNNNNSSSNKRDYAAGGASIQSDPGRGFLRNSTEQGPTMANRNHNDHALHTTTAGLVSSSVPFIPSSVTTTAAAAAAIRQEQDRHSEPMSSIGIDDEDDRASTSTSAAARQPPQAEPSFQDRLAATALSGTLELLKQVGGVTLSTTGALVAPPLHLTRTYLLPNLYAAVKEYIATASPVRLKDWFRIVHSSVHHVLHTLQNTEAGHAVSRRIVTVATDLLECAVADTTRQVLLDGMALTVKVAELLATPECAACLDQTVVTLCRTIDVVSHGRTKLLIHDVRQCVGAMVQLAADPATTTALAEVTAYLCYALEMEEHQQQEDAKRRLRDRKRQQENGSSGKSTTATTTFRTSSERRHERDGYQRLVSTNRDTLESGQSVEQVILDSLGNGRGHEGLFGDETSIGAADGYGHHSTTSVTTPKMRNHASKSSGTDDDNDNDDANQDHISVAWHERARRDVNVDVLRAGIEQRAVAMQAEKHARKVVAATAASKESTGDITPPHANAIPIHDVEELGVVVTVEADDEDYGNDEIAANGNNVQPRRQRVELTTSTSSAAIQQPRDDDPDTLQDKDMTIVGFLDQSTDGQPGIGSTVKPDRLEGETSLGHFHRILNEILLERRDELVRETRNTGAVGTVDDTVTTIGTLRRRPTSTEAEGGDRRQTVKDRLAALRAELTTGPTKVEIDRFARIKTVLGKEGKIVLMVGVAVVAAIVLFWIAFGCYGIYVFLRPAGLSLSARHRPPPHLHPMPTTSQEIVIRIIKEDRGMHSIERGGDGLTTTPEELENVAQCVAAAFK